jgi:hypothetical protein
LVPKFDSKILINLQVLYAGKPSFWLILKIMGWEMARHAVFAGQCVLVVSGPAGLQGSEARKIGKKIWRASEIGSKPQIFGFC